MLNYGVSDHCGLLMDVRESVKNIKSPFRFFNIWCDYSDLFKIVGRVRGTPVIRGQVFKV